MKESLKSAIGLTLFASCLNGVLLRNTAVVVAFHRVRNTPRAEGLTVSVPAFERYCQFFKDYFQVVPLREIVNRLERGQRLNRELAITFDDGYLDNFENAAPVLEKVVASRHVLCRQPVDGHRRRAVVGPSRTASGTPG